MLLFLLLCLIVGFFAVVFGLVFLAMVFFAAFSGDDDE